MLDLDFIIQKISEQVEKDFPDKNIPSGLSDPLEYTLKLPAKRYRCLLLFMAYRLYAKGIEGAIDAAMSIEYFHNFTLIHDDIMDQAHYRRGKPPVYKKWNTNTAVLSGDLLLIMAYQKLHKVPLMYLSEVLSTFNKMAQEVCIGQQYDMDFEREPFVSLGSYQEMIHLKTSVLLGTALKIGAILGGGATSEVNLLYDFGVFLGQMFQMQDDYIDVFGQEERTGKQRGGDILANKKSFVSVWAWEYASPYVKKRIVDIYEMLPSPQKVEAMIAIYQEIKIDKLLSKTLSDRYQKVMMMLDKIEMKDDARKFFKKFIIQIYHRQS